MNRNLFACVGVLLLASASGCAMCNNSQDNAFAAYGGKWQRGDLYHGRVASLFDPAGATVMSAQTDAAAAEQSKGKETEGEPVRSVLTPESDAQLLDESSQDVTLLEDDGIDLDAPPTDSEPAEATLSDTQPEGVTTSLETESDAAPVMNSSPAMNASPAMDAESENAPSPSLDQLPDILGELGIGPGASDSEEPSTDDGLPPLLLPPSKDQ